MKHEKGEIHRNAGVFPANSGGGKAKTATKLSLSVNTTPGGANPNYHGPVVPSYGNADLNVANPPASVPDGDPTSRSRKNDPCL